MNKPIKPEITIPQSFAENGVKTDFDDTLLTDGFDNLRPDVLAGDNLNKFIDDTYKGLNYGMAAADAINLINEGETLIVRDGEFTSGAVGGDINDKITNCLLEVPQNIKLELNNGMVRLKAGSKVIVPNGAGVFEEVEITSDKELTELWGTPNDKMQLFLEVSSGKLSRLSLARIVSGDTDSYTGTYSHIWYNTTTNKVNLINADGSLGRQLSLPIAKFTALGKENDVDTSKATSIDQVFNGMGYIGSTIWVDKGVKGLIPDGRNEDGTLRNVEITTNKVSTYTVQYPSKWVYLMINNVGKIGLNVVNDSQSYYEVSNKSDIPTLTTNGYSYCYCFEDNIMYRTTGSNDWQKTDHALVSVDIRANSTSPYSITSLNPKLPFRAVDYSDKPIVSGWGMPSNKHIDLTLGSSGTTYTAPANGYVYFAKRASSSGQWWQVSVEGGVTESKWSTSNNAQAVSGYVPVLNGQKFTVYYSLGNETTAFKFIYAEGAK